MAFVTPEAVATHFHIRPGDRVADMGAGAGHFSKVMAPMVGKDGKVFAIEIQRSLAESIADIARTAHLPQLEVIWGDLEALGGTKLPDGTIDIALFANVVSMLENKAVALQECARILRSGGKVVVIDWTDSFGGLGPAPHMVVTESALKELFVANGYTFEASFPAGDHHYGLSFRKK